MQSDFAMPSYKKAIKKKTKSKIINMRNLGDSISIAWSYQLECNA